MRNAILAAAIVFVAAVLVTGAQGTPTPQCTCPDGYVAACVAWTAAPPTATAEPPTVTPEPTSGGGMPSEGPNNPSAATSTGGSGYPWSNTGNVYASDNSYATVSFGYNNAFSDYLTATGFGFSIPAGSTIDGVVVEMERKADWSDGDGSVYIDGMWLVGPFGESDAKNDFDYWPTSDAYDTWGGASDKWGESLTVAHVNDSSFGFMFYCSSHGSGYVDVASVDHIRITVYYTEGSTGATRTQYRAMLGAGW